MDKSDMILERLDSIEGNFKSHIDLCQRLCLSKIENIDKSTNKAHERLDKQKEVLDCLSTFKNRIIGALAVILSIYGIKIFVWG